MRPQDLSIFDFTYALPEARIARHPLPQRDAARLLVRAADGILSDHRFSELPEQLPADTLLVLNDTRVVNARIMLQRRSGARMEVLCLEPADGIPVEQAFAAQGESTWNAFIGNAKRWKVGEEAAGPEGLRAVRIGPESVRFHWEPADRPFADVLRTVGHVPLPPYMHRPAEDADRERYNTVFAAHDGSVAAPTASLHLTPDVLERLTQRGVRTTRLTLHVGAGTFLPVKSARMADHPMHREQVRVPLEALEQLVARLGCGPIVPVGTTALRTLESTYWHGVMLLQGRGGDEMDIDQWEPYAHGAPLPPARAALQAVIERLRTRGTDRLMGRTRLLIAPGYPFQLADGLVTNFHQPQSTLLLLVAAFIGADWRGVYAHALAHDYRFLSYGDGSLLWRH